MSVLKQMVGLSAGTHTIGIVGEIPDINTIRQGGQLPTMLPRESPCAVTRRIADHIIINRVSIEGGQQVSPVGIVIAVDDCTQWLAQLDDCVGCVPLLPRGYYTPMVAGATCHDVGGEVNYPPEKHLTVERIIQCHGLMMITSSVTFALIRDFLFLAIAHRKSFVFIEPRLSLVTGRNTINKVKQYQYELHINHV